MLKHKVKNLELQMNRLSASKKNGVFFVVIEDGEYKVQAAGNGPIVFQGNEASFHQFTERYGEGSVFIIDDIPDTREDDSNLFDWIQ
jgi:sulfur relay (sulfurtransferase) DsrF/TusC family protein